MLVYICRNGESHKCQGQREIVYYENKDVKKIFLCGDNYDDCPCRDEAKLEYKNIDKANQ